MSQSNLKRYISIGRNIKEVVILKIALVGKARSGKDTVGEYLANNYTFKRFYFAQGIEEIINKYFPEAFEGGKPRNHYQHIGQELRALNKYVWINYLQRQVDQYISENPKGNVIVTDCRQANEEKVLREQGYLIVKVACNEQVRLDRILKSGEEFNPGTFYHDTEKQTELIIPHIHIQNDGTIEELYSAANVVIQYYNEVFAPSLEKRKGKFQ